MKWRNSGENTIAKKLYLLSLIMKLDGNICNKNASWNFALFSVFRIQNGILTVNGKKDIWEKS